MSSAARPSGFYSSRSNNTRRRRVQRRETDTWLILRQPENPVSSAKHFFALMSPQATGELRFTRPRQYFSLLNTLTSLNLDGAIWRRTFLVSKKDKDSPASCTFLLVPTFGRTKYNLTQTKIILFVGFPLCRTSWTDIRTHTRRSCSQSTKVFLSCSDLVGPQGISENNPVSARGKKELRRRGAGTQRAAWLTHSMRRRRTAST